MILTTCAACAAPLPYDAPQCARCWTRYCSATCLYDHWRRGHKDICKKIFRGGGAEKYHADKKYKEAVAAAVAKCADDTAGQTCYICYGGDEEGLVRGCACRGESGIAHVSCLVEQARRSVEQAERENLRREAFNERWARWDHCSLCEQNYHGVVNCALGWACWKTYVGRPEEDEIRGMAMNALGLGLSAARHNEDALCVREAELSMRQRFNDSAHNILVAQSNLAGTYHILGRPDEALSMRRGVYSGRLKLSGEEHRDTLIAALNYATTLGYLQRFEEAKALLRKLLSVAQRVVGEGHDITLKVRSIYALALYSDDGATLDDLREAVTTLEEMEPTARRVLGDAHPVTKGTEEHLQEARWRLLLHAAATLDDRREAVTTLAEIEPLARRVLGGAHPIAVDARDARAVAAAVERALRDARAALRARETPPSPSPPSPLYDEDDELD